MRKVLFTEEQISRIIGEDFNSYLPDSIYGETPQGNSYGTQVSLSDKDIDGEYKDTPTGDDISNERVPGNFLFRRTNNWGGVCESNSEMDAKGKTYNGGKKMNMMVNQCVNNGSNDKMLKNIANNPNQTSNTLSVRVHRLGKEAENDPNFFNTPRGQVYTTLKHRLNTERNGIKATKSAKKKMGYDNVYQKEGGTKTSGNGMAHTKKNDNGVNSSITYEN